MEYIYFFLSILGLFCFFGIKRNFDFLTIGFLSQQIYFIPCLVQTFYVDDPSYNSYGDGVFYVAIILVVLFIVFSQGVNNVKKNRSYKPISFFKYHALFATLLGLSAASYAVASIGSTLFMSAKADVLNSIDRFFIIWTMSAIYGLACSYLEKKKILMLVNTILILMTIYIGFRSIAVISLIVFLCMFFIKKDEKMIIIKDYFRVMVVGFFFILFFLVYKGVYIAIKFQMYDMVLDRLTSSDFYLETIANSEPFGIQRILNDVIERNYFIGPDNLLGVFNVFILFSNEIGFEQKGFNDYFQPVLYSSADYGVGSNIWAHMYSSGGWLLLIIFCILYVLSLRFISKKIYSCNITYLPLILTMSAYWSFYIYRNDLFYQLGLEKRVFIVFCLVWVASYCYGLVVRQWKKA